MVDLFNYNKTKEKVFDKLEDFSIKMSEKEEHYTVKKIAISAISFIGVVYLILLMAIDLFNFDIPFCSDACNVVSTSNQYFMYLLGIIFFLFTGIHAFKDKELKLFFYAGYVFELIQFANLVIVNNQFCVKCLVVVILITIIGFILDFNKTIFLFLSIYFSFVLVANNNQQLNLTENQIVLIDKINCKYCEEVKSILNKQNIKFKEININSVSSLKELYNIDKVPFIIEKKDNSINLYKGLNEIKNTFDKKDINNLNIIENKQENINNNINDNMFNNVLLNLNKNNNININDGCSADNNSSSSKEDCK